MINKETADRFIMVCPFLIIIACIFLIAKHFAQKENSKQYIITRANCTDSVTIKADTFNIDIHEHIGYFKTNNSIIAIDSINCVKLKEK